MIFAKVRKSPEWMPRCDSWVEQFAEAERPTAELLLDSITYITHEEVCSGLQHAVEELIGQLQGTCGLYPVTNTKIFEPFEAYDQLPFGIDGDLGGEGDLGHLCRDVCNGACSTRTLAFPCLKTLRERRVDHIILLTDFTSSGTQGEDYLNWMWACKTIRSWHSGRLVQFHYLSHLYAPGGLNRIKHHSTRPTVGGLQASASGDPAWTPDQRRAIEGICRKYGAKGMELGYEDMMSLQVFSYSCPNNVPSILRYGCRKKKFRGLFERRPTNVSGHAISGTAENVAAMAERLGVDAPSLMHLICHVLRPGPTTPEMLSARLGLPIVSINHGLQAAVDARFVRLMKRAYRLTPEGVRLARGLTPASEPDGHVVKTSGGRFDYLPLSRGPAVSSSNLSDRSETTNG